MFIAIAVDWFFSCQETERTEAMLFFLKASTFKQFKDQFRFLSTFVYFS